MNEILLIGCYEKMRENKKVINYEWINKKEIKFRIIINKWYE